jgi:DNA-binding transcriptional regulator YdaS (Cro superfamily)
MRTKRVEVEGNAVERAVWIVGGPTRAAVLCGVSWHTVWKWRKKGYVETARGAVILSDATGGEVSVRELAWNEADAIGPRSIRPRTNPRPR